MLGHAELGVAERYTRVSIPRLKAVHQRSQSAKLSGAPAEAVDEAASEPTQEGLYQDLDHEAIEEDKENR